MRLCTDKFFLTENLKNKCTLFQRKVPNGAILGIFLSFPGRKPNLEGTPHGLFIIKYFIVQIKFGILSPSFKKFLQYSISLSPKNRGWNKEDAPSVLCYRRWLLKTLYKLIQIFSSSICNRIVVSLFQICFQVDDTARSIALPGQCMSYALPRQCMSYALRVNNSLILIPTSKKKSSYG